MSDCITMHVGLDVHKESIEIATADAGGGEVRHVGRIGGDVPALDAALARLRCPVAGMQVVYEYLSKGVSMEEVTQQDCSLIAHAPNHRPRKRLAFRDHEECFNET